MLSVDHVVVDDFRPRPRLFRRPPHRRTVSSLDAIYSQSRPTTRELVKFSLCDVLNEHTCAPVLPPANRLFLSSTLSVIHGAVVSVLVCVCVCWTVIRLVVHRQRDRQTHIETSSSIKWPCGVHTCNYGPSSAPFWLGRFSTAPVLSLTQRFLLSKVGVVQQQIHGVDRSSFHTGHHTIFSS